MERGKSCTVEVAARQVRRTMQIIVYCNNTLPNSYIFPENMIHVAVLRPPLWSSGQSFWLQIQRSRVRFPALPDFLSSSGSGTESTQPREVN